MPDERCGAHRHSRQDSPRRQQANFTPTLAPKIGCTGSIEHSSSGVSMQDGMIWVNAALMGAQRREQPGRKCTAAYLGLAEAKQFEMLP